MRKALIAHCLLPPGLLLAVSLACNMPSFIRGSPDGTLLASDSSRSEGTDEVPASTASPAHPSNLKLTANTPHGTPTGTGFPAATNTAQLPTLTATLAVAAVLPGLLEVDPFTPAVPSETPVVAHLDWSLSPNYGVQSLSTGFLPDPIEMEINAGGIVDVSYLDSSCKGFATSAPDLRLQYSRTLPINVLRFYFLAGGDTTLIVNTPDGNYICSDNAYGTINPSIDIWNPASGAYDIWVGSAAPGTYIYGVLHITERLEFHP